MKPAVLLAAGAPVLALAGCGGWEYTPPPPRQGTIVELEYEEAESYQECGYEYGYNPATGKYEHHHSCEWVYEDECWEIDYETPEGDVVEDCIEESMWVQLELGMVYVEDQEVPATHTPWLTPSPSPSAVSSS